MTQTPIAAYKAALSVINKGGHPRVKISAVTFKGSKILGVGYNGFRFCSSLPREFKRTEF